MTHNPIAEPRADDAVQEKSSNLNTKNSVDGLEMKAQVTNHSSSCSTSISVDDTEGSKFAWADPFDSVSSWEEAFFLLEDIFSFGTYP